MADHDPLCTEHDSYWERDECPECAAIARVRADQDRFHVGVGLVRSKEIEAEVRERIAQEIEDEPCAVHGERKCDVPDFECQVERAVRRLDARIARGAK